MKKVLIVGATSTIAGAVCRIFAERGDALMLVGRRADVLDATASDLRVRGARAVHVHTMDAGDLPSHETMLTRTGELLGGIDSVLIAYGTLSDQTACEQSGELTAAELHNNAVSVAALLTRIGALLSQRRAGTIAVISSVAGDRGRASNYVYGSGKALVTVFASGLRQRLYKSGVSVITIKPGFVDTPMTATFRKGMMWTTPQRIARGIVRAMDRSTPAVYLPRFWCPIMLAIKMIPENLFRRLRL